MLDTDCTKCLQKFITKDINARLGCSKQGANVVKKEKWFKDLDWVKFANKEYDLPYKPVVRNNSECDSNFLESYPDSKELPAEMNPKTDPFKDFESVPDLDLEKLKKD